MNKIEIFKEVIEQVIAMLDNNLLADNGLESFEGWCENGDILAKKSYDINVMNTICNATEERQTEAGTIAEQSDAMLVIGGKHSSNTQKLYEICKSKCSDTYFIQTLDDLDLKKLQSFRSVGITAGASTPNNIIKEVQTYVRNEQ